MSQEKLCFTQCLGEQHTLDFEEPQLHYDKYIFQVYNKVLSYWNYFIYTSNSNHLIGLSAEPAQTIKATMFGNIIEPHTFPQSLETELCYYWNFYEDPAW